MLMSQRRFLEERAATALGETPACAAAWSGMGGIVEEARTRFPPAREDTGGRPRVGDG